MNKILVFTATYNEIDNIASLLDAIFAALPSCDVLVVDDNSPDKTGELLEQLRAREPRLRVIHRPGKNGLGTAHKLAVKYALAEKYDALITMDADFSHDPSYLPEMVRQLEEAEFVIGSRYVEGGSCEYPLSRVILSRVANSLARGILGIPVHETTTSYRGFRRSLLQRMNIDAIRSEGYSYFVESIYQVGRIARAENTPRAMAEFPIRFVDRRAGTTKISKKEIWKGFSTLMRLGLQRVVFSGKVPPEAVPAPLPAERLVPCNVCGSSFQVEEYPASHTRHAVSTYSCTSTGHESHGRIVQCLSCGLVYTNPQLTSLNVLSFYSQVEDKTYVENLEARTATFTYNLDAIARLLPKAGRILDVGSYCGVFLKIARERGYEVLGVEPSVWASSYARETLGIPTVTGSIEDLPADEKPFDVVCSWDVLEHVADPMAQLKQINRRLVPGGIHAFSTLDYRNWYPRLLGERWPWMMDMHIYYFDQKVMKQMLAAAGFRLVHHEAYSHIITLEYFLKKLAALGVPGSEAARALLARTPASKLKLRFHFGDIQLYVCEKIAEVAVGDDRSGRVDDRSEEPVPGPQRLAVIR
ncbi:MAG TPA: methyltransferase domain-containing protein [Polyangia bacterium]|nr:methyltransferase domain-containing protein [Polyangia bacterium]